MVDVISYVYGGALSIGGWGFKGRLEVVVDGPKVTDAVREHILERVLGEG